jgi:hypothetical protein
MTDSDPSVHSYFMPRFDGVFSAAIAGLVLACATAAQEIPAHRAKQIREAAPERPRAAPAKPRRVLVWNTPAHLYDKDPHKG